MILHLTHNDLDGAGCAILSKKTYQDKVKIVSLAYDTIDDYLVNNFTGYDELLITDISVKPETLDKLPYDLPVTLIDHHKTTQQSERYNTFILDTTKSGTLLFYEYLISKGIDVAKYKMLIDLINDYDLWIHKYPQSKNLNKLFYLLGWEKFIQRFLQDAVPVFKDYEDLLLDLEQTKMDKYIKKLIDNVLIFTDNNGSMAGIVFAENYTSEAGSEIVKQKNLDYVILVDLLNKKVSLRSREDVDVSTIAKQHGGGGHKNAAGYVLITYDEIIKQFLKQEKFMKEQA